MEQFSDIWNTLVVIKDLFITFQMQQWQNIWGTENYIKELRPDQAQYSGGKVNKCFNPIIQILSQDCQMVKLTQNLLSTELLVIETTFLASNLKKSFREAFKFVKN